MLNHHDQWTVCLSVWYVQYSVVCSVWCLSVSCWQTHDNLEHLAIMERVLGPVPASMIRETKYDFLVVYCHLSWRCAVHLSVLCVCVSEGSNITSGITSDFDMWILLQYSPVNLLVIFWHWCQTQMNLWNHLWSGHLFFCLIIVGSIIFSLYQIFYSCTLRLE